MKPLWMSETIHWNTPDGLRDQLDLDPCPSEPDFDGLMIRWGRRNFVNPPYGRELAKWVRKAYEESLLGSLSVMLVPSRTDTAWWHEHAMRADEIRFLRGRLKFYRRQFPTGGEGAPFPSALLIFRGGEAEANSP